MANCTDGNCGHASTVHTGYVNGKGPGLIGAQCSQCANKASGVAQCKGFVIADTNCDEAECGHTINHHSGLGLGCLDCTNDTTACSGGNW
jgi:hypothetical protein